MRATIPKTILLGLLVAGLAVAAAGCGGGDDGGGGEATPATTEAADTAAADTGAAAGETAAADTGGGAAPSGEPILIGIAAAKTGALAPYDLQPGQALQMRAEEINAEGGVLGRPLQVEWIDTKSDKALAATAAQELIDKGAVAIIGTCDFDYSAPALFAARDAGVPGLSLCASSPKAATPAIVGDFGGSMGEGSDTEGVTMAEWINKAKPDWKRAYILKDTSLEYSKATADYFKARWQELGGEVCGEADFVGGENTDVSSQVTQLRGLAAQCDFVYDGSWLPGGAVVVRQIRDAGLDIPIVSNNSVDGTLLTDIAGPVSNYYSMASVCIPSYCSGEDNPDVQKFFDAFKAKYGDELTNSYPARGYDLMSAIATAIEQTGSTDDPSKIADTLFNTEEIDTLSGPVRFTPECHRPQPASHVIEEWTDGKATVIERYAVQAIPDIGDGSSCSGEQIPVPGQ